MPGKHFMDFNNFLILLCCCVHLQSSLCHASRPGPSSSSARAEKWQRDASPGSRSILNSGSPAVSGITGPTNSSLGASITHSGSQDEGAKQVTNSDNELHANSSTIITLWRPYFSYIRQVPSLLWSHFGEGLSINSLIQLNLISIGILSMAAFVSFLMSPESNELFERMQHMNLGTRVEEMARSVELAIDSYGKVDPEVCLRMAACTLGKQNRRSAAASSSEAVTVSDIGNNLAADGNSSSSPSASSKEVSRDNPLFVTIQVVDKLLRLMNREKYQDISRRYTQGREYGSTGGDCDAYNRDHQCPLDSKTWNLLLNSLASVLY